VARPIGLGHSTPLRRRGGGLLHVGLAPRVALALMIALLGMIGAATPALADVEPNDGITQAEGPLAGGITYTGTVDNSDDPYDLDTYVFYAKPYQAIDIQVNVTQYNGNGSTCLGFDVAGADNDLSAVGDELASGFLNGSATDQGDFNCYDGAQSDDLKFPTSGTTSPYYLEFRCVPGEFDSSSVCQTPIGYSFEIAPTSAVVPGPATLPPRQTGEPNENQGQAIGPLAGNVAYSGEIQTINDQDWFKFTTSPGTHQVDLAVAQPVGSATCTPSVELMNSHGTPLAGATVFQDEWYHFPVTAHGRQTYYIQLDDEQSCYPSNYELVLEPAAALTTTGPARCVVPQLAASTPLRAAESAVLHAHCSVRSVRHVANVSVPRGDVIKLRPAPNSHLKNGAAVTLTVSTGPPCVIPRVRGMSLRAAQRLLKRGNCRVGRVLRVYSRTVGARRVVKLQFPAADHLPSRRRVTVDISRGRRRG
jgi:hypothetical protein